MLNYSTLHEADGPLSGQYDRGGASIVEQEDSGVLVHMAEPSRARWNHIDDLDSFFSRMYRYHQRNGFLCMMIQELLELGQFVFVVTFTTYMVHCVNYPVLFKDEPTTNNASKVTIPDVVHSSDECIASFGLFTYFMLLIATLVWAWRLVRGIYHMVHFWDIKQFYNSALGVPDDELGNLTWNEVQTKVRAVQVDQQMCIQKRELTELDIHHRILRQQNYLVAMTNKQLIPPRIKIPFVGELVYWTKGLRYNIQLLLFWGPSSPFQNRWQLREEYRKPNLRHEMARKLQHHVLFVAMANLLLAPLILLWQILYAFFSNAELIRREPGSLGMRSWSLYGKLYLRHFNELDHELQDRLCRAHRPAMRYLSAFSSPLATIIARSAAFMFGSLFGAILLLTIYDEDVLNVEHMLTVITVVGGLLAACRAIIPDEAASWGWCPEALLTNVLAHTHYLPSGWKGQAHTNRIRQEFQQLFQYRAVGLLEELLSPLVTPYVLYRCVYPRTLDIVDFFRNFTVSVEGVEDVCSFAQMDVRKHGNLDWLAGTNETPEYDTLLQPGTKDKNIVGEVGHKGGAPNQYTQAEDGKIELSLMHFALTNPTWTPPHATTRQFISTTMKESADPHYAQQMQQSMVTTVPQALTSTRYPQYPQHSTDGYMPTYHHPSMDLMESSSGLPSYMPLPTAEVTASNEMAISTWYLHDRHYRYTQQQHSAPYQQGVSFRLGESVGLVQRNAVETTPLLGRSHAQQ